MAYVLNTTYRIKSFAGNGKNLNVYGLEQVSENRRVCLWSEDPSANAQKWMIKSFSAGLKMITALSSAYALNYYWIYGNGNPGPCDIHTHSGNDEDSCITLEPVNASQNIYYIKLANYNLYMTAAGNTDNADVTWEDYTGATAQQWKLVPATNVLPTNSTYTNTTIDGFNFHVLTTSPSNIVLKNLCRTDIANSSEYGINAAFFTTAATDYQFYNIAVNNGVLVGPDGAGDYNGSDCGSSIIAYHNGSVKILDDIITHNDAKNALGSVTATWIQGGQHLYLGGVENDWISKWHCGHNMTATSTRRTAIVINTQTNMVYLIVASSASKTVREFRNAIKSYFGITDTVNGNTSCIYQGLMLDGGGSSAMRAMNSNGSVVTTSAGRPLNQIIALINP